MRRGQKCELKHWVSAAVGTKGCLEANAFKTTGGGWKPEQQEALRVGWWSEWWGWWACPGHNAGATSPHPALSPSFSPRIPLMTP
ncbi:hypothetical protein Pcinc_041631 [Petrolisthes cinctipes]|uniref:Uncharacterized protein n=1 Tax=Petrolisthes cinctipes TaxID=88211 RepID=A0AAE1BJ31_PETCI|nr:hypothetical protein Pcinc_041631 [Petrolisthes cinctipes]